MGASSKNSKRLTLLVVVVILSIRTDIIEARAAPSNEAADAHGSGVAIGDTIIVETKLGVIRGVSKDGVQAFHGVPFAQPPVGDLRWRPPEPVTSWSPSEYDATRFRPACPQHCGMVFCPKELAEDCLYLEIYTPAGANETSGLAVDVYIHGGAFDSMSANSVMFEPTRVVQRSGIVIVLIQYRLGALGFLVTEGTEDAAQGNFGILDQRMAVTWIHENIQAFGGDPSQVTLHGQSAGAQSTAIHLTSPAIYDYFRAVILESDPLTLAYKTKSEAALLGRDLAEALGCLDGNSTADMACLRNKDAFDVLDKQSEAGDKLSDLMDKLQPFAPVIDGDIVKLPAVDALDAYSQTTRDPKPILWGFTSHETRSYVHGWLKESMPSIAFMLLKNFLSFPNDMNSLYPSTNSKDARDDMETLSTDGIFRCPMRYIVNQLHKGGHDAIWVFEWAHTIKSKIPEDYLEYTKAAQHGIEVPFVWQSFHALNVSMVKADLDMSNTIMGYYARFIKYGNPNGERSGEAHGVSKEAQKREFVPLPKTRLSERVLSDVNAAETKSRIKQSEEDLTSGVSTDLQLSYWPQARETEGTFTTLVFGPGVVSIRNTPIQSEKKCNAWDRRGYTFSLAGLSF